MCVSLVTHSLVPQERMPGTLYILYVNAQTTKTATIAQTKIQKCSNSQFPEDKTQRLLVRQVRVAR